MDYSKICYKRSFLSQVIVRTDFLKFIPSELLFSETVLNNIVDKFPQKGMQQVMRFEDVNVIINQNESTTQRSTNEGFQQEFKNLDNNKIIISNKYIILEINKYSTFEYIMDQYRPILQTILAVMQVIVVRTGVRYINIASMQNHGGLLFVTIRRAHKNAFQEEHFSKKAVQKPYSDVLFSDDAVAFPSLLYQDRGAKTDFSLP